MPVKVKKGKPDSEEQDAKKAHAADCKCDVCKAKDEDEDDVEKAKDDEDLSDLNDDEKKTYANLKAKVKRKVVVKADGAGHSPDDGEADQRDAQHSTSPNQGVPSTQNVFVPDSSVQGKRTQDIPAQSVGKSTQPDLTKSPLFVGINKQLEELKETAIKRLDSFEKSVNDRLANVMTEVEKAEAVFKNMMDQPLYKSAKTIDELDTKMAGQNKPSTTKEMVAKGKARFTE